MVFTIFGIILLALGGGLILGLLLKVISFVAGRAHETADRIREFEERESETDIRKAVGWIVGAVLSVLALIGFATLIKGLGSGPAGKGAAILVLVAVLGAAWGIATLVRRGYGKWLLAAAGVAVGVVVVGLGLSGVRQPDFRAEMQRDLSIALSEVGDELTEVGSEISAELNEATGALFTAASSKIELGAPDAPAPPEGTPKPEVKVEVSADDIPVTDSPIPLVEPLPEWATASPDVAQVLITSAPDLVERAARENARHVLVEWAIEEHNKQAARPIKRLPAGVTADDLWERLIKEEHVQRRETSVGDTYIVYGLSDVTDADRLWFSELAEGEALAEQRRSGVAAVTAVGGGTLLSLAVLYGALSWGERRAS